MKSALHKILNVIITVGFVTCLSNSNPEIAFGASESSNSLQSLVPQPVNIDIYDTVVFDISQADISGNTIEFPVYFLTNDVINALDFSLKYNDVDFLYDTIININSSLQSNSFYNANDSTIRYTSFSLTSIPNNTPQVLVKFTILSGTQFCMADVNTLRGYLNGDECSIKVIECQPSAVGELNGEALQYYISPNPASDFINVTVSRNSTLHLLSADGKQVISEISNIKANESKAIDVRNLAHGIYLVKIFSDNFLATKKIIISK